MTDPFVLRVKRVRPHDLPPPSRQHETDAGLDLPLDLSAMLKSPKHFQDLTEGQRWNVFFEASEGDLKLLPGARVNLPTGWAIELPPGYEGQIRGRSGLAFNKGVTVGHIGTIDAGFRGEIRVCLINAGSDVVRLQHGDRIAQLVIAKVPPRILTMEVGELNEAPRGDNGYGSTGR